MENETEVRRSTLREYYETLLIAFIILNFVRIFVFQAFKIPTGSMVDNLLVGDHIFVNKFVYGPPGHALIGQLFGFRDVERGDIVVFRYPKQPDVDYVKRVVGMPGDLVTIRDKKVFVNGQRLDEPYTVHQDRNVFRLDMSLAEPYRSRDQFGPYRVEAGSYFVMGDNRDMSYDSRYWGTVPRTMIKGRPVVVYWSFDSQATGDPATAAGRFRELFDVAIHFFSNTRWNRTFFIVDSRYHSGVDSGGRALK
jgi:signal peptidase I